MFQIPGFDPVVKNLNRMQPGVGLIALIMVHVYFGLRPEKRAITKSMIFGWMSRDFYLKEHDPKRWVVEAPSSPSASDRAEDRGLTDAG